MALAYLKYGGEHGSSYYFTADIGSNQYYQYLIGRREDAIEGNGIPALANARYVSPLQEAPRAFSGWELRVERELFDREYRKMQLLSFRTADKKGPALSEIVSVVPRLIPDEPYTISMNTTSATSPTERRRIPFNYREVPARQMSVNWMQILGMIPNLLDSAAPVVQAISGLASTGIANLAPRNGAGPAAAPAAPVQGVAGTALSPEHIEQLIQAIQQLSSQNRSNGASNGSPAMPGQASVARQMDGGLISGTLISAIAPAVLQNLPQLLQTAAPVLQQVLSPEVIHALGDPAQVNQLLTHLMNTFAESDRIRQESMDRNRANRLNFFRQPNPIIQQYLQGRAAAASLSKSGPRPPKIDFVEGKPVTLMGKPRLVYAANSEIRFPFTIDGATSYPQAIAQLRLITTESNVPQLERKYRLKAVNPNESIYSLKLSPADLQDLPRNEDLLLDLLLKLRTEDGKVVRARKIHRFRISADYIFDRVQKQIDSEIPLNDLVQHRDFWHKVWESDLRKDVRRFYLEGKYYTLLEGKEESSAILETKLKAEPEKNRGHRAYLKFKSGMQFSLYRLNRMLPQLSGQQALNPELLDAISSPEVIRHFQKAARAEAEFRGRPGDTVSLWAYPVLAMHEIILQRPEESDINGQVVRYAEEVVDFPMPVAMHFVGTISETA